MAVFGSVQQGLLWGAVMAQILAVVNIVLIATWLGNYLGGFSWSEHEFNFHPFFMVLSLNFIYGEAILSFRVLPGTHKPVVKLIHAGLQLLSMVFCVVGVFAVFDVHNKEGKPHAFSAHSWIGLGTVVLFFIQFMGGFFSFLIPATPQHVRAAVLPVHRFFGVAIYVLAVATMLMGAFELLLGRVEDNYHLLSTEALIGNFFMVLLVLNGLIMTWLLTKGEYRRDNQAEEGMSLVESR